MGMEGALLNRDPPEAKKIEPAWLSRAMTPVKVLHFIP
jgi:hypothetical protein